MLNAPENSDEFRDVQIQIPSEYPSNAGLVLEYPDDDPQRTGIDGITRGK